ncbi:beta-1,3-glucanosyltransferase [Saitoella complicata NRRL Y-17804]|nr:beta-1,3-glucanosyltransferase [Saitoella complicata NRRL Y-17804]ODQ56451.1 beta-1,3-glucanosyltransferase [Saitoella complicata NRRL Y-17804]
MKFSLLAAAAAFTSVVSAATSLPAIEILGNKFFYSNNGSQFYVRGVAYQNDVSNTTSADETFVDPLADTTACQRDVKLMEPLGINSIRVYAINTSLDHTGCIEAFADAGIYIFSDLSEPSESIDRDSPAWNTELYDRYTSVVDALANYTNVAGFFAGNEVTNNASNTDASAFVKAAVRDVKSYMTSKGYRSVPVGYSTNDDSDTRIPMAEYFNCGDNSTSVDFYGVNIYEWCGDSSYTESGYSERTAEFANFSVPLFMSEFGCNTVTPRPFTEVQAIYGSNMTGVWSGGIVYQWFQTENDYGLVSIGSDGAATTLTDYNNLKTQLAKVSPTTVMSSTYTPTNTAASCPTTTDWEAAASPLPPTPNALLCECMVSSLSCGASSGINDTSIADLFGYICGLGDYCGGITANGTSGSYGAYSMCTSEQQLSFVMNAYYQAQGSSAQACDFGGLAATTSSASATGTCSALLKEAGTAGTGTVTDSPASATSSGSSSKSTSGSSAEASGSTSSGAARVKRLGEWKVVVGGLAGVLGGVAVALI